MYMNQGNNKISALCFLIALQVFASQAVLVVKNSLTNPGDLREADWIPRSRRAPGPEDPLLLSHFSHVRLCETP